MPSLFFHCILYVLWVRVSFQSIRCVRVRGWCSRVHYYLYMWQSHLPYVLWRGLETFVRGGTLWGMRGFYSRIHSHFLIFWYMDGGFLVVYGFFYTCTRPSKRVCIEKSQQRVWEMVSMETSIRWDRSERGVLAWLLKQLEYKGCHTEYEWEEYKWGETDYRDRWDELICDIDYNHWYYDRK